MRGHGKNSNDAVGGTVVYYDRLCNPKMSSNTTKISPGSKSLRRRRWWWQSEHLGGDGALLRSEAFPEPNPGQCVRVINELTDQWAAWRNLPAQKPVERHLKVVCDC